MSVRGLRVLTIAGVCALGAFVAALAAGLALSVPVALAAGDANEASCPAETEASPGFRTFLPDCRAFELVTPPYKEGGTVFDEPAAISPDGSQVIVGVAGAFAGAGNYHLGGDIAAYELTRGASGWQAVSLSPSAVEYPYSGLMAVSAENFETTLWGAGPKGLDEHEDVYLRTGPGRAEFHPVGPGTPRNEKGEEILASYPLESALEELNFVGASRDLEHSVFRIHASNEGGLIAHGGHSNLWPGDTTEPGELSLYEYVYDGVEVREPVLVGVDNEGPLRGSPAINDGAKLISDCGTELGSGEYGSAYNAVSDSGSEVFFTAAHGANKTVCSTPVVNELYVRVDGEHTVAISEPVLPGGVAGECSSTEPCRGAAKKAAVFEGASEDGSRVFFLSEQPLVDGAPAAGVKLYGERLGGPGAQGTRVTEISDISNTGASGVDPEVQGVVRVSENGERVYFVAKGKLTGADTVHGRTPETDEPQAGADNLYVYEPEPGSSGAYHVVFVSTLLNASEESALKAEETEEQKIIGEQAKLLGTYVYGSHEAEIFHEFFSGQIELERALELLNEASEEAVEEERVFTANALGNHGPSGTLPKDKRLWEQAESREAQATPDGAFLAFASSARLTKGDESRVSQVFEYDAGGDSLTRVSIGQTGQSSGNVGTFRDAPHLQSQSVASGVAFPTEASTGLAISADGSEVFFTSAAALAPQARAEAINVYEYREGAVYLVSGGADASLNNREPAVALLGIDPSAQDAFFTTTSQLVPQDGETQQVLYDARERGGFPAPVLASGCFGEEACRGPAGPAVATSPPGSASQAGGGNVAPTANAGPHAKRRVPSLTRAEKLAKALKICRAKRNKHERLACEKQARKRYPSKSSKGHK